MVEHCVRTIVTHVSRHTATLARALEPEGRPRSCLLLPTCKRVHALTQCHLCGSVGGRPPAAAHRQRHR